jgi:hypothetical protein
MRRYWQAIALGAVFAGLAGLAACDFNTKQPFSRMSPEVDKAISELDAGLNEAATERLNAYLKASGCKEGQIVAPGSADAHNAAFDMGLSIFRIAETFGKRFEETEALDDGGTDPEQQKKAEQRAKQVACAHAILDVILSQPLPLDLEARARYLRGNLSFLSHNWDDAVHDYDRSLMLIPGIENDAGDGIGRDAAWNRALALKFKQQEEDSKKDGGADADADADADGDADADADADGDDGDGGGDADADSGEGGPDSGDAGDSGKDSGGDGGGRDGGNDAGGDGGDGGDKPKDPSDKQDGGDQKDAGKPPPPQPTDAKNHNQDDRMLDRFEQAPTWQQETSKSKKFRGKVYGMEDK